MKRKIRVALTIILSSMLIAVLCFVGYLRFVATPGSGQAFERTGDPNNQTVVQQSGPTAARILPYALLAEQAYDVEVYVTHRVAPRASVCADNPNDCDGRADDERAARWLQEWRYVWSCDGPDQCRVRTTGQSEPVGGLGVQIWARKGAGCPEVVIAFRGTVGGNAGDWESNFHWIFRALPIYDQYDQVRDHIGDFISHIERDKCYRERQTEIVAVGHSVGGGLAQDAAYSDPRIRHVYVFATSATTGYYSINPPNRDRNVQGLLVERTYEEENLSFWLRQLSLPSPCNPRVVDIQFNLIKKIRLTGNSMDAFTNGLLKEAKGYQSETNPLILQRCQTEPPPLIADDAARPSRGTPQLSVPLNRMIYGERPVVEALKTSDTEQSTDAQYIEVAKLFLMLQSAVLTLTVILGKTIFAISRRVILLSWLLIVISIVMSCLLVCFGGVNAGASCRSVQIVVVRANGVQL